MYYEVYIDIVFVTNLLLDYLLLRLVGFLFRCGKSRKRYFCAAAMGALFSCLILWVPGKTVWVSVLLHGACAMGMIRIGCGLKKGSLLIKGMFTLYLAAFLCGGFWDVAVRGKGITLKMFFMIFAGTYLLLSTAVYLSDSIRTRTRSIYPITLLHNGKKHSLYGFYDTGNLLSDPLTGVPVSVMESKVLEMLLPQELVKNLKHLKENPGEVENTEFVYLSPHYVPYHTIEQNGGILLTITLEELCIHTPGDVVRISKPRFALLQEPSALGNGYKVLLNSKLLD